MKLTSIYSDWITSQFNISTLDLVNQQLFGLLGKEIDSFGKSWETFEALRKELGDKEFEVYIQSNIQANQTAIKKRGFYPSLLVNKNSLDHYVKERESIYEMWGNPSNRFKSKLFGKLFPSECTLVTECLGQYSKHPENPLVLKDLILTISHLVTGEWLVAQLDYDEKDILPNEALSKYKCAKANSKRLHWETKIPLESIKATVFACIQVGKPLLGSCIHQVEIPNVSMDRFNIIQQFVQEITQMLPTSPHGSFSIIDHEK